MGLCCDDAQRRVGLPQAAGEIRNLDRPAVLGHALDAGPDDGAPAAAS